MHYTLRRAARFFWRALWLRCPECGDKPIFVPWHKVRSLRNWFTPLDGCPRCGYAYEREPGYFLMSIWAINYGGGCVLGIVIYVILETCFQLPLSTLLVLVILPVVVFNFLFARHSKAFFLALDHFFDPHNTDGDDDGGNKLPPTPPTAPSAPEKSPSCEPPAFV